VAENLVRPIIVKRIKKTAAGHHGGAWKIAYADFVTAMMAFFLLMWLLGSTSKAQLEGIEQYFRTPLSVALSSGSAVGASESVIKGGGKDVTKKQGQVKPVDNIEGKKKIVDIKDAKEALKKNIEISNLNVTKFIKEMERTLKLKSGAKK
jgi:chemotaxis protein MotB